MTNNDSLNFDVLIVGAGPAGLACAIELGKQAKENHKALNISVIDKGSEVGAHILSGNVLDPKSLNALIPDWRNKNPPIYTEATQDQFYWLTEKSAWRLPTPPSLYNSGNYIISLSQLCRWLAKEAEQLGINIIPGYAAVDLLYENKEVVGIITNEVGRNKDGSKGPQYQPGLKIYAKQTVLAEGCYGFVTEKVIQKYNLCIKNKEQ